jgi:hypothetical protein
MAVNIGIAHAYENLEKAALMHIQPIKANGSSAFFPKSPEATHAAAIKNAHASSTVVFMFTGEYAPGEKARGTAQSIKRIKSLYENPYMFFFGRTLSKNS